MSFFIDNFNITAGWSKINITFKYFVIIDNADPVDVEFLVNGSRQGRGAKGIGKPLAYGPLKKLHHGIRIRSTVGAQTVKLAFTDDPVEYNSLVSISSIASVGNMVVPWYDRSPTVERRMYIGIDVAPHSYVERFAYTVPAARRAIVTVGRLRLKRTVLTTTINTDTTFCEYKINGGSILTCSTNENVVEAKDETFMSGSFELGAGDVFSMHTGDGSIGGGTMAYHGSAVVNEYDA